MSPSITISENTLERLKAYAEPFVDREPEDVIVRLLGAYESSVSASSAAFDNLSAPASSFPRVATIIHTRKADARLPRQRGATVMLDGKQIDAVSVRDLYEQSLRYLVDRHLDGLTKATPYSTSRERYLVAQSDTHPNGRSFVMPVEYGGFYMEAHKDYKNAVAHLEKLTRRMGLSFEYVD